VDSGKWIALGTVYITTYADLNFELIGTEYTGPPPANTTTISTGTATSTGTNTGTSSGSSTDASTGGSTGSPGGSTSSPGGSTTDVAATSDGVTASTDGSSTTEAPVNGAMAMTCSAAAVLGAIVLSL
jgi:cobalamin biosynthesis Mg chelatase CobN